MSTVDTHTRRALDHAASLPRAGCIALNGLIVALWLWLYRPVFEYLGLIFSRDDFRTNQVVLTGVLVLIVWRVCREGLRLRVDAAPQMSPPALALALGGSALYLAAERFLDVNTLSASLFGLASYGLLGLWMHPHRWRKGIPALLLLVGTLPFDQHLQTFVGYPVRILTAIIVRDGLQSAGVASLGADTILMLENGVAQVDLPCSGVRSLWSGAMFLVAATWVERRQINFRWLLTALILSLLVFTANLVRVGVLVAVGEVLGWRLLAEMLHVPLGLLGFAVACAVGVGVLRLLQPYPQREKEPLPSLPARPIWLAPALLLVILAMVLAYAPRPQTGLSQPLPAWDLPSSLAAQSEPLKPDEIAWLTRDGAESAARWHFEWRGISGSMLLITSRTWRAHHRPERCFEVYGLSLNDSRTLLVRSGFPVRFISLGDDEGHSLLSATYWFQSAGGVTADYGQRIWADLAPRRQRWVLATVLFNDVYDPRDPDVQALYEELHAAVARGLAR